MKVLLTFFFLFSTTAWANQKADVISKIRSLQESNRKSIQTIRYKIDSLLEETEKWQLERRSFGLSQKQLERVEDQLQELSAKHREHVLRTQVFDRILFTVDHKYKNEELKPFLHRELLRLAKNELLSPAPDLRLWKYYIYQAIAMKESNYEKSHPVDVIETYINYSSLSDPKTPHAYLQNANYTQPGSFKTARPFSQEGLGEYLEKKKKTTPEKDLEKAIETLEKAIESSIQTSATNGANSKISR